MPIRFATIFRAWISWMPGSTQSWWLADAEAGGRRPADRAGRTITLRWATIATIALDSRYWGFVPRENIVGRPLLIYWSIRSPEAADSSGRIEVTKLFILL